LSRALFAVVVNWNGGYSNVLCLRSLVAHGVDEEHVVFVDNGSSDGSIERVACEFPRASILRNARNTGYGDGTNQGMKHALELGAELVFLVNNDVVVDPSTLPALVRVLDERPSVGIVGPRIVYASRPQVLWSAGGRMTYRQNLSELIGHDTPDREEYRRTLSVDYVAGCALLVRRSVVEEIGFLDGEYFAYHEDVDFCLKAKEAGHDVLVVGEVRALHDAHQSTGGGYNRRRKYMMGVNTVWFLRRHGTPLRWASFLLFDVLTLPFVWCYRAVRGESGAVVAKARGTWDGLRGVRVSPEAVEESPLAPATSDGEG